jgi:hypothetical protein
MPERKNIQNKKFVLEQFFTAPHICKEIADRIDFTNAIIVDLLLGQVIF